MEVVDSTEVPSIFYPEGFPSPAPHGPLYDTRYEVYSQSKKEISAKKKGRRWKNLVEGFPERASQKVVLFSLESCRRKSLEPEKEGENIGTSGRVVSVDPVTEQ